MVNEQAGSVDVVSAPTVRHQEFILGLRGRHVARTRQTTTMTRDDEQQGTTAGGTGSFLMAAPVAVPPRSAAAFPLRTMVAMALAAGLIGMAVFGGWDQSLAGAEVPTAAPTVGQAALPLPTAFTAYVGAAGPAVLPPLHPSSANRSRWARTASTRGVGRRSSMTSGPSTGGRAQGIG